MATLQIRELPDDLYEALAAKARAEGRSLAQQAIVELRVSLRVEDPIRTRAAVLEELTREPPLVDLPLETLIDDLRHDRER